jgi:Na+/proline symporter/signal transduction histidine kinase/CheY-like chemotaxis protein
MLAGWVLFLISAAYVALLFAVAYHGDRRAARRGAPATKPWTYSLALGVYCTSWTFYGAVGRAADSGWDFLPIYLGPLLVFAFGHPLIARLIQLSKRHNITSIADFIGARYGRHQKLAMGVTLVVVVGVLPYIALQLKAVAFGFEVLSGPIGAGDVAAVPDPFHDSALFFALLLAGFSILFGTRQVVSSENHHGMVLAIAFESTVKLLAFVAVGLYACYGVFGGIGAAYTSALALPQFGAPLSSGAWHAGFFTQTLLAAIAILCLPRQFHVAVVENTSAADLQRARWVFPLYLLLISVLVLPIAAAGLQQLPAGSAPDTFVLALPRAAGQGWLALFTYLGGFSAATGMVIVETIALSTMLSNEVVMPLLLGSRRLRLAQRGDLSSLLKAIRRGAILLIVCAAYLYDRLFAGSGTLSAIGLLSFAAVAQFAPSVIGGLLWRGGSYQGALAGLAVGFVVWVYTLLLPTLLEASGVGAGFLADGPWHLHWLRPQALFGTDALDNITHGALWSTGLNLLVYLAVPWLASPGLRERLQAARFLEDARELAPPKPDAIRVSATVGDLLALLERFFGAERARSAFDDYAARQGRSALSAEERASPELARHAEHLLSGALGTSSARLVLASALRGRDLQFEDVIRLLDETSHEIQFNRELLRAALENLPQGVSVVDKDLRLVAWNRRYVDIFDYPPGLILIGRPIEDVLRFNIDRGLIRALGIGPGEGDPEAQVARRLSHMRAGHAYTHERALPNGRVIETRGQAMPGGGYVTSYSDVTAYTETQAQLREINETLESRVAERTAAADEAKLAAERANQAKTRFLASASHDLVQPLNAARLFVASIDADSLPAEAALRVRQVGDSLTAAESLLGALLDISRLDAASQELVCEHVELSRVLEPLAAEFAALAQSRGLDFRRVPTRAVVYTDPRLLRRVLQNFLSNAVRYTRNGSILIGCRRAGSGRLRIEVWDTGPGIAPASQQLVFEEFRRLDTEATGGERGLGLGLAIADRLARLLGHPLGLRSWPGRGSVFTITLPLGSRAAVAAALPPTLRKRNERIAGTRVLVLDNEPAVLDGMRALLEGWGCRVIAARDLADALADFEATGEVPDLALIDFHLDSGGGGDTTGISVVQQLRARWNAEVPGVVITADHTAEARAAAAAQGYALLAKPVKPAALRALMSRLLDSRESQPIPV